MIVDGEVGNILLVHVLGTKPTNTNKIAGRRFAARVSQGSGGVSDLTMTFNW